MATHSTSDAAALDFQSWHYPFASADKKCDSVSDPLDATKVTISNLSFQQGTVYVLVGMNLAQQQQIALYVEFNRRLSREIQQNGIYHAAPLLTDYGGVVVCVENGNMWLVKHILNQLGCDSTIIKSLLDKVTQKWNAYVEKAGKSNKK